MTKSSSEAKTVVLVHGGFVDGSGWEGVYNILRKDGYFLRRGGYHRGGQRSESCGPCLYHRVCAG